MNPCSYATITINTDIFIEPTHQYSYIVSATNTPFSEILTPLASLSGGYATTNETLVDCGNYLIDMVLLQGGG